MGVSWISSVCSLPFSSTKEASEHTVYAAVENSTAVTVFRVWLLAARAPGLRRILQFK